MARRDVRPPADWQDDHHNGNNGGSSHADQQAKPADENKTSVPTEPEMKDPGESPAKQLILSFD